MLIRRIRCIIWKLSTSTPPHPRLPLNTGELTVSLPVWLHLKWGEFKPFGYKWDANTTYHLVHTTLKSLLWNVENTKCTFLFSASLFPIFRDKWIVQSRSTTMREFIPGWLIAVSNGSDSRTGAPTVSFALMFEGISVATAHAGTTSRFSPPHPPNWATLEFAGGLEGAQRFSSAPKWVPF